MIISFKNIWNKICVTYWKSLINRPINNIIFKYQHYISYDKMTPKKHFLKPTLDSQSGWRFSFSHHIFCNTSIWPHVTSHHLPNFQGMIISDFISRDVTKSTVKWLPTWKIPSLQIWGTLATNHMQHFPQKVQNGKSEVHPYSR